MTYNTLMRIAQMVPCTEAEGPGRRFALWFQGCPLRCPGCCNPEFLRFEGGEERSQEEMHDAITQAQTNQGIEGLTLLGGEPFAHAKDGASLAQFARSRGLSVMIFTGFTIEELQVRAEPEIHALLSVTDILVDGPYRREEPDTRRRWIGSRNQRIHFLTDRYHADDPCWRERNTLEIRVSGLGVSLNGFPGESASALWKGWKRRTLKT